MSNRHVRELSRLYRAIFQDLRYAYPDLEVEFERDLERLERFIDARGIHGFTVDLPAIGKHFDRCLSDGEYKLSGLPLTKRYSNRVVIPKFLRGLLLLVFDEHGRLLDDADVQAVFLIRQVLYLAKKTKLECSDRATRQSVVDFYHLDRTLPQPSQLWDDPCYAESASTFRKGFYCAGLSPLGDKHETFMAILDIVSGIVSADLGPYDPDQWRCKHGPGAVSEVTGPSNKYDWKNWSPNLEREFPIARYGFHSYDSWADRLIQGRVISSIYERSRLVAVPKTVKVPRLIAAEPSENQWCQQNIWHYFRSRVRRTWLSQFVRFHDQTLNQQLCMDGSTDGALVTLDLESASDSVSCLAVEALFRGNLPLLRALAATRTHVISQSLTSDCPNEFDLWKFSTMGNACTFPVESLMFLSICLSACLVHQGVRWVKREDIQNLVGKVAVFGDDIVIPKDARELVVAGLESLRFKVNAAKSYWNGSFRESCGVDAFRGVNVTPIYWRQPFTSKPESLASTVDVVNNFYKKFLITTAAELARPLPRDIPVVEEGSGAFGFQCRTGADVSHLKVRYCPNLQHYEYKTVQLRAKQERTQTGGSEAVLQYFTEAPLPSTSWKHGVPQRPLLKLKRGWEPLRNTQRSAE